MTGRLALGHRSFPAAERDICLGASLFSASPSLGLKCPACPQDLSEGRHSHGLHQGPAVRSSSAGRSKNLSSESLVCLHAPLPRTRRPIQMAIRVLLWFAFAMKDTCIIGQVPAGMGPSRQPCAQSGFSRALFQPSQSVRAGSSRCSVIYRCPWYMLCCAVS